MKKHLSKKRVVLAAIVAVALAITSGVAYAYWTSGGSGTGSAAVASAATNAIGVTATVDPAIYPGGTSTVSFKATNSASTSSPVGTIHLASVASTGTCQALLTLHAGQLTMGDVSSPTVIPANTSAPGVALTQTGSLLWTDASYSQDDCKGASFTLTFTTS